MRSAALLLLALATAAAAAPQPVKIHAYLNVSSGCQAATVDFLNALRGRYAPHVKLELTDFGDQGKGLRRWQASGYRCMTIELNGSPRVKFPQNGQWRAVDFVMPVGLNWTHGELEAAVKAGLAGQLHSATVAEVQATAAPRRLTASVATGAAKSKGVLCATVTVNGLTGIAIPGATTERHRRAQSAAAALKNWLSRPVQLSALQVKPTRYGWALQAGTTLIATATAADGKTLGQQPKTLAEQWLAAVTHALARPGPR